MGDERVIMMYKRYFSYLVKIQNKQVNQTKG